MRVTAIQNKESYDIYIGRACYGKPASPWQNPFKVGRDGTADECLAKYEAHVRGNAELMARLPELQGKVLACWCKTRKTPDAPCHGDVLIKIVIESTASASASDDPQATAQAEHQKAS